MWCGKNTLLLFILLLMANTLLLGCVTQTERIYPHERIPEDESVWDEVRREFGWRKNETAPITSKPAEPFYKRAARGVKETLSGWFRDDSTQLSADEVAVDRRRFERKREEALQQLREQQEQDQPEVDEQ
jgi:hypothetical protein